MTHSSRALVVRVPSTPLSGGGGGGEGGGGNGDAARAQPGAASAAGLELLSGDDVALVDEFWFAGEAEGVRLTAAGADEQER